MRCAKCQTDRRPICRGEPRGFPILVRGVTNNPVSKSHVNPGTFVLAHSIKSGQSAKSHLRPLPDRPCSVPLPPLHSPTLSLWWACLPGMHQPPPAQHLQPAHCKSKAVFFGGLACPSPAWPLSLRRLHLEFCKRAEAINSSCNMTCGAFHKNTSFILSCDILQSVPVVGGGVVYVCNCFSRGGAW